MIEILRQKLCVGLHKLLMILHGDSHDWVCMPGIKNGRIIETPLMMCSKCGALKPGYGTITITADYIDLALLTADPIAAEGRLCYRSDLNKGRYYDGTAWVDFP